MIMKHEDLALTCKVKSSTFSVLDVLFLASISRNLKKSRESVFYRNAAIRGQTSVLLEAPSELKKNLKIHVDMQY